MTPGEEGRAVSVVAAVCDDRDCAICERARMTRTLKFYGASDDLFEIEGTRGSEPDEVGCYDNPAVAKVSSPTEGEVCIVAHYAPDGAAGCWSIGLMPVDEGVEIPNWPMSFALGGRGYTTVLTITAPDDAVVSMIGDSAESSGGK